MKLLSRKVSENAGDIMYFYASCLLAHARAKKRIALLPRSLPSPSPPPPPPQPPSPPSRILIKLSYSIIFMVSLNHTICRAIRSATLPGVLSSARIIMGIRPRAVDSPYLSLSSPASSPPISITLPLAKEARSGITAEENEARDIASERLNSTLRSRRYL